MPEFNKINVIKELLNVKYNFASVPVPDLDDIVLFCIESLCTEQSSLIFKKYFDILTYNNSYNKYIIVRKRKRCSNPSPLHVCTLLQSSTVPIKLRVETCTAD